MVLPKKEAGSKIGNKNCILICQTRDVVMNSIIIVKISVSLNSTFPILCMIYWTVTCDHVQRNKYRKLSRISVVL